jgi:HSP20 family protein
MSNLFPVFRTGRYNAKQDPFTLTSLFDGLLNFDDDPRSHRSYNMPRANIVKSDNGYGIELAAPGYSREEFEMSVDHDQLTIGLGTTDTEEYKDKIIHREYQHQSFKRSFSLPEHANIEGITARYEAGILYVHVPVENKSCTKRMITVE